MLYRRKLSRNLIWYFSWSPDLVWSDFEVKTLEVIFQAYKSDSGPVRTRTDNGHSLPLVRLLLPPCPARVVLALGRVASMMMRAGVAAPVGRPAPRGRPYPRPLDRRYRRHRRRRRRRCCRRCFSPSKVALSNFQGATKMKKCLTTLFNIFFADNVLPKTH